MVQSLQGAPFNKETFTHEIVHKLMHQLFQQAEPYSNNVERSEYHNSITKTLNNILNLLEQKSQIEWQDSLLKTEPNYNSLRSFERGKILYNKMKSMHFDQKESPTTPPTTLTKVSNASGDQKSGEIKDENKCVSKVILDSFLSMYASYASKEEDAEFIVRYPEAIASVCYDASPTVRAILEPIKEYWDKVIEKKMDEYIAKAGVNANTLVCPADTAPFGLEYLDH